MKKILFSLLMLAGITATAQVKVGTNPTTINTTTTNFQVEGTTTADQFVVLKNGNVGIGTTTPTQKLTIAGGGGVLGVDNTASFAAKNSAGVYEGFLTPRWNDDIMYMDYGANGFNIRNNAMVPTMFMTNSGNVGIGTTTPATALDLAGRTNGGRLLLSTQGWVDPGATAAGIAVDNVIDKTLMIVGANFGSSATNSGLGQREVSLWDNVTVNGRLKVRGGNPGAGKVLTSDANGLASWQTAASGADGDAWGVTGEDQNSSIFRNGNVGIGTAPRESFYIRKGIAFHTGGNLAMFFNGYYDGGFKHAGYGGSNFSGVIDYSPALGDYNFVTSTAAGAEDALATTSTLLTLKQSGNVGIGTTAPNAALQLGNVIGNRRIVLWEDANNDNQYYGFGINNSTLRYQGVSHGWFTGTSATTSAELMRLTSTGNLGIGTGTPAFKLTLGGGTGDVFGVENGSSFTAKNSAGAYESFLWPRWTDNVMYMNFGAGGFNIRNNASASTMFMTNSGNVGIGTTTPASKLDVPGSLLVTNWNLDANVFGTTTNLLPFNGRGLILARNRSGGQNEMNFLDASGSFTGGYSFLKLLPNGTTSNLMSLRGDGNVGIGTTNPTAKLEVNGAATNSSASIFTSTTIDFSLSNLAATSDAGAAITLNNLKNGGAYTLVFTSTAASGTVAFTAPGFSIVEVGTVARTAGKKHIYNFVVIGTEVYVTMGTQN